MSNVDLKFNYHGFNREDGQCGHRPRNQPVEVPFFEEDMDLQISATNVLSRGNPCLEKSSRVDN